MPGEGLPQVGRVVRGELFDAAVAALSVTGPGTLRRRRIDRRTDRLTGFRMAFAAHGFGRFAIVAEKVVEFGVRHHAGKTVELALVGDFARRLDEGMHGDARQRAAHADAAHAHLGEVFDGEAERAAVEKIDRLRRDRLHGRLDLLARLDAGRIEAIGAGIGKGLQPADGLVHIGPAADEALGAGGEHDVAAGLVDRRARGLHAGEREVEIVERLVRIAGRVLDRQAGDAGLDAARHVLGNAFRIVGVAALEVGVDRHVGCVRDLAEMRQHHVARHVAVGIALRMRKAGTGGRQRLEAEPLQIAGAADVPRIGNDEAAGFMQAAEDTAFIGGRGG